MKKLLCMALMALTLFACGISAQAKDIGGGYDTDESSYVCTENEPEYRTFQVLISYKGGEYEPVNIRYRPRTGVGAFMYEAEKRWHPFNSKDPFFTAYCRGCYLVFGETGM